MGGEDETETQIKTKIRNKVESEISTTIKNNTEIISSFTNDTTANITDEKVSSLSASIRAEGLAENVFKKMTIVAANGSSVTIDQNSEAAGKLMAMSQLLGNNKNKIDFAQAIASSVDPSAKSGSELKSALSQQAALSDQKEKSGGFGDMVGDITDMASGMLSSMTGGTNKTSNTTDTAIENTIKNKITTNIALNFCLEKN